MTTTVKRDGTWYMGPEILVTARDEGHAREQVKQAGHTVGGVLIWILLLVSAIPFTFIACAQLAAPVLEAETRIVSEVWNTANNSQNDGKGSHPNSCVSHPPSHPVGSAFFFLLGFMLMKLAFYVGDEPDASILARLCSWGTGILSAFSIFHSITLFFGITVTQKGLTTPRYCNTFIDSGRMSMANVLHIEPVTSAAAVEKK